MPAREVVDFFTREPDLRLPEIPARPLVTTGRRVFQLHNRYLVEETDDGLRILDQHALHERVMLEEFRKQFSTASIAKQRLLLPAVVTLTKEQRARLDDQRELLDSFGLECEDFGRDGVAVRAVPALVAEHDPVTLLTDFLELSREAEPDVPLLERALEFMACRAAVKFGRKLADEEIARLLQDAAQMDFSATCAHGRPTGIKLTLDDLERFFPPMMQADFEVFEPSKGFRVFVQPTTKFKTITLSLYVHQPLGEQATKIALLPRVLRRGCRSFPDMRSIVIALEDLFGRRWGRTSPRSANGR
jgi:hypothetical protein